MPHQEGRVGLDGSGEHVVAADGDGPVHPGDLAGQGVHLLHGLHGPQEGGGRRELDRAHEVSLILLGDEAAGHELHEEPRPHRDGQEGEEHEGRPPDRDLHAPGVSLQGPVEPPVEGPEEDAETPRRTFARPGPEEEGAEGRGEGEGDDGREDDRHGDGHGELLVELAGDAPHEGHGDEDRGEDEGDGDHRSGHVLHGPPGGLLGAHALGVHVVLDRLHHHDGVVHHDADGQDHSEEGEGVDGEPEGEEGRHGPHEGDGDGEQGDEGGAPALEEEEDHDEDEDEGLEEGLHDLREGFPHEDARVGEDLVLHVRGEPLGELLELGPDEGRCLQGARVGGGVHGEDRGGFPVARVDVGVIPGRQLHPGDVPQTDEGAVGLGVDDDGAELVLVHEASLHAHRVLEGLVLGGGALAHLARGGLDVLLLDGGHHILRRDAQARHLVGAEPDAHAEVRAEGPHVAHALEALHRVHHVDGPVVVEPQVVVGAAGRVEDEVHEDVGLLLLDRDAVLVHLPGEARGGPRHAVLDEDRGHVRVFAQIEGDVQAVAPVAGALGVHVEHAVHAVDLLFDGLGDGLFHHLGAGAEVDGEDVDGGEDDVGVLGDGEVGARDTPRQEDDDGHHDGEDRPVDEELRHGGLATCPCRGREPKRPRPRPAPG